MKAISISSDTKIISDIEIQINPNTVYTFFSSILIDESTTLQEHTIYTDANALSQSKQAFFLGEQLLIGDALITGKSDNGDIDSTIPLNELEGLVSYELSPFYVEVLDLLSSTDINLYRAFNLIKDGEKIALSTEWVLYTFNIADERTKEYFINELKKSLGSTQETESFIQKMATLALNAV